jgi:hypothetical protein
VRCPVRVTGLAGCGYGIESGHSSGSRFIGG